MRHVALLVAGLTSVLALAACGSSSNSTDGAAASADARDTARLQLQACLRKQGVDIPSPGQGQGQGGGIRRLGGAQAQKVQKALQGPCKAYASKAFGNVTPQQRQEFQDQFAKFSACMRQHGVDIPTFTPGQGPPTGQRRINPNTPKFQTALKACQSVAPNRGGGGRGGFFIGPAGGAGG